MAERLLLARLPASARDEVRVSSAGTRAVVGHSMDAASAMVLRELGGDPGGHVGRQLEPVHVSTAGLILTATGNQRDIILRADPAAMRRTFTMREFARLADSLDEGPSRTGDLAQRVRAVAGQRGVVAPAAPGADEVADPIGAPLREVRACGQQISAAVDALAALLQS
jgi:protein-tyrosine phosphatase